MYNATTFQKLKWSFKVESKTFRFTMKWGLKEFKIQLNIEKTGICYELFKLFYRPQILILSAIKKLCGSFQGTRAKKEITPSDVH